VPGHSVSLAPAAAPDSAPSAPTTADSSPPSPNRIRIAKLDALAAHFDIMADANDARLDAMGGGWANTR